MLIEPLKAVGKIRVGMTTEDVVRELGQPDKREGPNLNYSKLGFSVFHRDGVVRVVNCGFVSDNNHPMVKAFKGRTKEGIGMGSSRADVIKAFGQPGRVIEPQPGYKVQWLCYDEKGLRLGVTDGKVHAMRVSFEAGK